MDCERYDFFRECIDGRLTIRSEKFLNNISSDDELLWVFQKICVEVFIIRSTQGDVGATVILDLPLLWDYQRLKSKIYFDVLDSLIKCNENISDKAYLIGAIKKMNIDPIYFPNITEMLNIKEMLSTLRMLPQDNLKMMITKDGYFVRDYQTVELLPAKSVTEKASMINQLMSVKIGERAIGDHLWSEDNSLYKVHYKTPKKTS